MHNTHDHPGPHSRFRAGIPELPAPQGTGEGRSRLSPTTVPPGGRDAELEAAELLLPPTEGSPAALGEARGAAWGREGRAAVAPSLIRRVPQSCAGLRLVARGLSDAQAVLSSLPSPELFPGVAPTLELLASATRDVVACVSVPAPGPSTPPACSALSRPTARSPLLRLSRSPNPSRPNSRPAGVRGAGLVGDGPFASSVYLPCPLQLELARPGSSRKALRAPRRRPHRRRAVSGAGAERVDGRAGPGGVGWGGVGSRVVERPGPRSLDEEIAASAPLRFLPGFQDSPGCYEATVIFNLLRLLTWDLKLAAHSGPCL